MKLIWKDIKWRNTGIFLKNTHEINLYFLPRFYNHLLGQVSKLMLTRWHSANQIVFEKSLANRSTTWSASIWKPVLETSEISLSKSNLRKKIMAFDNRLWVRLQLCNPKTCQKCAKIAAGHGSNLRKSVCQRLLNYKNCCSRTFLLTRGFK